jgi:integral membrane sensor domain MASE1
MCMCMALAISPILHHTLQPLPSLSIALLRFPLLFIALYRSPPLSFAFLRFPFLSIAVYRLSPPYTSLTALNRYCYHCLISTLISYPHFLTHTTHHTATHHTQRTQALCKRFYPRPKPARETSYITFCLTTMTKRITMRASLWRYVVLRL